MKFPLSWLREYIDPGLTPAEIGKALTAVGIEVDSMEMVGSGFDRVVVGRVLKVEKHPNADRLRVAQVSIGSNTFQVVCGAPNCREGIKSAFACVGAILRDEAGNSFTVKETKLRGIASFGMLCSQKELQLGEEADGIIEFSEHIKEGTDVSTLYADTIFEVALTPNLGHCASIIGIARELAAAIGKTYKWPQTELNESSPSQIDKHVKISIQDSKGCPRYACRLIQDLKVAPSPEWMQRRLLACGLRPVNNIVDVTNYVFLEMGHPLHAFDYETLEGKAIVVRLANEGERFVTLDGKERLLQESDLLICDNAKPIALAGVMGGANSEVRDTTKNVLLEAAYFHPGTIRKTSKRLGLVTDASKHFERGCDPNQVLKSLDRAAMLLEQVAGGRVVPGTIDVAQKTFAPKEVSCRLSRINSLLGTQLSVSEVEAIFQRLNMPVKWDGQDLFLVKVPTYRVDISQEVDLIEEVARLYGYDNIGQGQGLYHGSSQPHVPIFGLEREVRARLVAEGLQEVVTCDLIGPTLMNLIKEFQVQEETLVRVLNPTSIEQSILRTSLLPGLLNVIKYNIDHQVRDISCFEIGRVHFKTGENYKEQTLLGIVLTGKAAPHSWGNKPEDVNFFELKGILDNLLKGCGIETASYQKSANPSLHSGRQASIYVGKLEIGSIGEVHPAIQRRLDVTQRILFAELSLQDLMQVRKTEQIMRDLPIYPSSERDWTLTVKEAFQMQELMDKIQAIPSANLEEVKVLDVYRSEKLGVGLKNLTLRFIYRDQTKTLEQEAVDTEHGRIVTAVLKTLEK